VKKMAISNSDIKSTRIATVSKTIENKTTIRPRNKVTLSVSVKVLGEAKPEELSKGTAYAFSKGGTLLGKACLNAKGSTQVEVNLPVTETAQSIRLIIGPDISENQTIGELLRLGGEQVYVQIAPKISKKDIAIEVISKQVLCWILSQCTVRGNVTKKVVSGGVTIDLPVCGATVEIYEVDPIYILIPKLPIEIIEHIREFITKPPPPIPHERQPFERVPSFGPTPPQPLTIGNTKMTQLVSRTQKTQTQTLSQKFNSLDESYAEVSPSVQSMLAGEDLKNLRILAQTTNTEQFRQVLINYGTIARAILCLFPFAVAHMDLVATATTAECGKFKALFFRGCNNVDKPDLYFKVKQKVIFALPPLTIYAPTPVLCNTYWNYQCGTQEVTLNVTHPLARPCALRTS
jgi:hypothetical protein